MPSVESLTGKVSLQWSQGEEKRERRWNDDQHEEGLIGGSNIEMAWHKGYCTRRHRMIEECYWARTGSFSMRGLYQFSNPQQESITSKSTHKKRCDAGTIGCSHVKHDDLS